MNYLGLLDGQELIEGYEHYIWMSERCLAGIAWSEKEGLDYTVVPKNWSTDAEIRDCQEYLEGVKRVVLEYARDILNAYHHADYSVEQWNILLSQWIQLYLTSYYDKYLKLRQVEDMGIDCECDLYAADAVALILDYTDYVALLAETDAYHVYQYSRLYAALKPFEHIAVRRADAYERPAVIRYADSGATRRKRIYSAVVRAMKFVWKDDAVVLQNSYLSGRFLLKAMLKRPGKIINYIYDYLRGVRNELPFTADIAWRNREERLPEGKDEFTALMCAMLKQELPAAYVECFALLKERAKVLYRHAMHPKAILFSSGGICEDELFKAYLMEVKPTGALLCGIQHGGNYGISDDWYMKSEYTISDVFYTWGWSRESYEGCVFRPMPMVKLVEQADEPSQKGTDILYVSYCNTKNLYQIERGNAIIDAQLRQEKKFLRGIPPEIKKILRYRPFPSDFGWGIYSELKREIPDLRFDTIPDFYESVDQAKLAILADWETTISEALDRNRPILVKMKDLCMEESAKDDLMELERVGVLARDFETLGKRLEEAFPDIEGWWNEPERQAVVKRIRDKYAYLPPNAEQLWEEELLRLADM